MNEKEFYFIQINLSNENVMADPSKRVNLDMFSVYTLVSVTTTLCIPYLVPSVYLK